MNYKEITRIYEKHYNPTLALLFECVKTRIEDHDEGGYVYDDQGDKYLDFACGYGVFSVGHKNPRVQAAMLAQLDKMAWAPLMTAHEPGAELVRTLAGLMPDDLKRVYLCGSGSEAIEIALRIAGLRKPERTRLCAVNHGFHGKTLGATGICGQNYLRSPFEPIWDDVRFVPYGDFAAMERAVAEGASAVIIEAVLGGGFITVAPPGYLKDLRALCDKTGTLLIVDEVQTGFARTGKMFGFEHDGITPDILIVSKGMTGGHVSMAAAVVRESVIAQLPASAADLDAFAYVSDTAGSPLACAASKAAIDFIVDEKLVDLAAKNGPYLQDGLRRAAEEYPSVGLGAPGIGLMTGLKVRNNMVEMALWLAMLKRKVVTGLSTNPVTPSPVMRFFAPLTVSREQIDVALGALDESLREMARMPGLVLDLANEAGKYQFKIPKPMLRGILKAMS